MSSPLNDLATAREQWKQNETPVSAKKRPKTSTRRIHKMETCKSTK